MTLRELTVRNEAGCLRHWDGIVTLQSQLELLVCKGTRNSPRSWLELHPLRTKAPQSAAIGPSGFDALLDLARI